MTNWPISFNIYNFQKNMVFSFKPPKNRVHIRPTLIFKNILSILTWYTYIKIGIVLECALYFLNQKLSQNPWFSLTLSLTVPSVLGFTPADDDSWYTEIDIPVLFFTPNFIVFRSYWSLIPLWNNGGFFNVENQVKKDWKLWILWEFKVLILWFLK